MTAAATLPRTRPTLPAARRRWDDAHPGWWLGAGAALAWVVFVFAPLGGGDHHTATAAHHAGGMAAMGHDGAATGAPVLDGRWALHWVVMVVAMMWPLVSLQAAAVRRRTRPPWRVPAVGAFVAAYTAGWLVVGLAARVATTVLLPDGLSRAWLVGWLAVAALAAASTWRIRTLRACGRLRTIAPAGRRSLVTAARAGLRAWRPCAVLCGPVMAAMVVAHPLWVLAVVSGVVWFEQRHALAWRHPLPPVVLGLAAGAALLVP